MMKLKKIIRKLNKLLNQEDRKHDKLSVGPKARCDDINKRIVKLNALEGVINMLTFIQSQEEESK